jgi:anti-anti-sigma factor
MAERRIELDGEYDLSRKEELVSLFASLDGDGSIVIDMANVSYIDSTILHELSILRNHHRDREITLTGANSNVKRILHLVNFERLFGIT